jgi:hypothetical protein
MVLFALRYLSIFLFCIGNHAFAANESEEKIIDKKDTTWIVGGFYEGDINGTPFQINISFPVPSTINEKIYIFSGEYWYPRRVQNKRYRVHSPLGKDDSELLIEADIKFDEKTGQAIKETFSGKWVNNHTEAQGVWFSELENKKLPFHMKLKVPYEAHLTSYLTQHAIDDFNGRRTTHLTIYPRFSDSIFDSFAGSLRSVQNSFTNIVGSPEESNQETEDWLLIVWASPDYIFFSVDSSFYGYGAAHPLGSQMFAHFKKIDGDFKFVDMKEFYPDDSRCMRRLSDQVVTALKNDDASHPEYGAFVQYQQSTDSAIAPSEKKVRKAIKKKSNWSNFLVSPMGIGFDFGQYSMGNYVESHYIFIGRGVMGTCGKQLPKYAPLH